MSLILNSLRTIAHTSIIGAAPALSIGASKLARTNFNPIRRSQCATIVQSRLQPKALTEILRELSPTSAVHRVRPTYARRMPQRQSKILAAVLYDGAFAEPNPPRERSAFNFGKGFGTGFGEEFMETLEAEGSSEEDVPQDENAEHDVVEELQLALEHEHSGVVTELEGATN
ncbi:hypothetical protein IQ07DRAFT_664356 [Pyrenochaeta sp. DS3sAY3a]|nr:hypothetical protein IQ07DRAFT_664356 [Pyrenochaeta sp. DS3sAY3a]